MRTIKNSLNLGPKEDVLRLMATYKELALLPPAAVEALWAQWSEDTLCASWIAVPTGPDTSFEAWLFEATGQAKSQATEAAECAVASQASLGADWARPEEDEAWKHLNNAPQNKASVGGTDSAENQLDQVKDAYCQSMYIRELDLSIAEATSRGSYFESTLVGRMLASISNFIAKI